MTPTEAEILVVRNTIAGRPPPGRLTVGGILRLEHLNRLHYMSGLSQERLLKVWDLTVAGEHSRACGAERPFDLPATLKEYGETMIELVAQNREIPVGRINSWKEYRRRELFVSVRH